MVLFGYDPILNKKEPHNKLLSVLQKFLLKKKFINSLLVTVVVQFTAKTTNSEKAIYFLSLMPCSINKLKPHMLFTCKSFMSFNFTWKKNCSRNDGDPMPPSSLLSFSATLKGTVFDFPVIRKRLSMETDLLSGYIEGLFLVT